MKVIFEKERSILGPVTNRTLHNPSSLLKIMRESCMQTSEQFHIFEKKNEMLKLQHYWDYLFIIVSLKKQARKKTEFEISRS